MQCQLYIQKFALKITVVFHKLQLLTAFVDKPANFLNYEHSIMLVPKAIRSRYL